MVRRSIAAAAAVVIAAVTGLATNLATDSSGWGWWTGLAVLVLLGAGLQVYLTWSSSDAGGSTVTAAGPGSIAVGGSARGGLRTKVAAGAASAAHAVAPAPQGGVTAAGPGAVAVGGDADGPIDTEITA
ncbi:hypothetical protein GCM10009738_43450 [Kitasatospora viridis]|uniref:Uncharacterized protein n=1 Tax=Kitasatospora viridis TaxID=281105 RepID=A0A561TWP5_9ACTN|nr:hypothetical protein FHX73_12646 [Kitasatospora viridis]